MTTLKRLLFSLGLMAGLTAGADAATYYFSTCSVGCEDNADITNVACDDAGTQLNPFCADPNNDGVAESFARLADGINDNSNGVKNPELAAGDTIKLCAANAGDDCNGAGSATLFVSATGTRGSGSCSLPSVFSPTVSGTSGAHITIVEDTGESVTISGDTNNDGDWDAGEPYEMFHINGDYEYYDVTGIDFKRFRGGAPSSTLGAFLCARTNGAPGWTFDGSNATEIGDDGAAITMYGATTGIHAAGCVLSNSNTYLGYGFFIANQPANKPFTFKNSTGTGTICGGTFRIITNPLTVNTSPGSYSFVVTGNVFRDALDAFEIWDTQRWQFNDNTVYDVRQAAVQIEDRNQYGEVLRNDISARGTYDFSDAGRTVGGAIIISSDNGIATQNTTRHQHIARNTIWQTGTGQGFFGAGITVREGCANIAGCSDPDFVIEDNILWNLIPTFTGFSVDWGAINILVPDPVTIQNNTLYDVQWPIILSGRPTGHTVRNNLINAIRTGGQGLTVMAGEGTTGITFNNLYDSADIVYRVCATNSGKTCSVWGATCTAATLSACITQNNIAQAGTFVDPNNATVSLRDYHLSALDTYNVNTGSPVGGGPEDIDGTNCPQAGRWEIGADELVAGGIPCGTFEGDCEYLLDNSDEGCAVMGATESFTPSQSRCANAPSTICTSGTECTGGAACINYIAGRCSTTATTTCVFNTDCPAGTCSTSAVACHTSAECGVGQTCVDGESCVTSGDGSLIHGGTNTVLLEGRSVGPQCGSVIIPLGGLSVGTTYDISCYYQATGAAAGDKKLSITIDGVEKCSVTTDATSWTLTPTCTFVAGAATAEMKLIKPQQAAGTTTYRVDDCTVTIH